MVFIIEPSSVGAFSSSCFSRFFINVGMEIIMMNVFRVGLTTASVMTIWNVIPSSLGFISIQNIGTVVPLEPSPHLLRKHPSRFMVRSLMKPMIIWAFPILSPCVDMSWEFTFKSWNNVVELKSVGRKMNPTGVISEDGKGLSGPHTIT